MTDVSVSPEFKQFKRILKRSGNFITKPRIRLFNLLQNRSALSIEELIPLLNTQDQATVYRNIKLFEELGIIKRIRLGNDAKFEVSDTFRHHHHHLTCTRCGRVIVLKENLIIEREITRIVQKLDFKPLDHQLEISGLCHICRAS